MEDETPQYMLGTSDAELERLGYQHQVWSTETIRLWRAAGFGRGQKLLDLGCGPGFATADLAHLVGPCGHLFAVDQSRKFLEVLQRRTSGLGLQNVSCHEADVHDLKTLASESLENDSRSGKTPTAR